MSREVPPHRMRQADYGWPASPHRTSWGELRPGPAHPREDKAEYCFPRNQQWISVRQLRNSVNKTAKFVLE